MKTIPLTNGGVTILDDEDYAALSLRKWHKSVWGYVVSSERQSQNKPRTLVRMHRVIMGLTNPRIPCDHRDLNPLNNQRQNLRVCTVAESSQNRSKHRDGRLRFKGLMFNDRNGRKKPWQAKIQANKRLFVSPSFATDVEAAKWYDEMAIRHHGAFAQTNASLGLPQRLRLQ